MSIKSRYQDWKTRNGVTSEDIAVGAITGATLVGFVALFAWAVKVDADEAREANREAEEKATWAKSQLQDGKHVFITNDGTMIATSEIQIF